MQEPVKYGDSAGLYECISTPKAHKTVCDMKYKFTVDTYFAGYGFD